MTIRFFATAMGLALTPAAGFAEWLPHFDVRQNTWNATHIVVTEGGKVVESWKGDLKVGDVMPEGAARFARIPVPGPNPWLKFTGEKPLVISGKRMVLFLAFVPQRGEDPKKPVWTGADAPGYPASGVSAASVAWIEGNRVYSAHQPINPGGYVLCGGSGVAGLKQCVDVGIALRPLFEAAKLEKDPGRRVERFAVLLPIVSECAGFHGVSDCIEELSKCGATAVPYLTNWALEPKAESAYLALGHLSRLGNVGIDGMVKVLDAEIAYWRAVAKDLGPGESVDRRTHADHIYKWRGPNRLHFVLAVTRAMKLSAKNKERLQEHAGLKELDKVFQQPGMKPEMTTMVEAHEILKDILAGKFKPIE